MLGTSLLWRSTVAFNYLKVKSAKCVCLLPVVLVLSFWSLWCKQRSWSCYFGLGLQNLVLFTSLTSISYFLRWKPLTETDTIKAIRYYYTVNNSVLFSLTSFLQYLSWLCLLLHLGPLLLLSLSVCHNSLLFFLLWTHTVQYTKFNLQSG